MKKNGKKEKSAQLLPGLPPGAPEGSFPLSSEEAAEFRALNAAQRLLQAEAEKMQLQQNNLFLRIQIRTGQDMQGWGVDIQKGLAIPPSAQTKSVAPPTPPPAPAPSTEEKPS